MVKRRYDTEEWPEQSAPSTPSAGFIRLYVDTSHKFRTKDSTGLDVDLSSQRPRAVTFVIDGGGVVPTTGAKSAYVSMPFSGTITRWVLLGIPAGAAVLDVWKDTIANFPPTNADSITGTDKPTLTATDDENESTALTGWTTTVTAGDILEVEVESVTTCTKLILVLWITPS